MNRKEFITKTATLILGSFYVPQLLANESNLSSNKTNLIIDPKGILDLPPKFSYKITTKK